MRLKGLWGLALSARLRSTMRPSASVVGLTARISRQGVCAELGLDRVKLTFDDRERLKVDENYRTEAEHVYAVGDVGVKQRLCLDLLPRFEHGLDQRSLAVGRRQHLDRRELL